MNVYKQLFVLFILVVLVLASGCSTTPTNPQPPVQPTTIPTPVPTTVPTPVPTTIPPNTVLGCWKLDAYKGDSKCTILLELQSGGTGRYTEVSSTINIRWYQDPITKVVNVSFVNPYHPTEYIYMDFDYDETADTLTWLKHPAAPFTRVQC